MYDATTSVSPEAAATLIPLSGADLESYDRLKVDCVRVALPHLALLKFTGDDRKGWLQGQVTNNLRTFEAGSATAFCFCAATGHLQAMVEAWAFPDFILATTERPSQEAVIQRVAKMVIMENVEVQDISEEMTLISIQGPQATQALSQFLDLPTLDSGAATLDGAEVYALRSNRTGVGGWDVLVPTRSEAQARLEKEFAPLAPAAYDVVRLEAGIPRLGSDANERTLPPELGPAFASRTISYNKGCYMGQEVLMRIHSRGHTNKTWMALLSEQPLAPGDLIHHSSRPDAGVVTSAVYSPDYGYLAGAMIRNEAAFAREIVTVSTRNGEVEAEVRAFPVTSLE